MTESLFAVTFIAVIHVLVTYSRAWTEERAGVYLAFAGGGAAAFGFLNLLPSLARAQPYLQSITAGGLAGFLTHHSYVAALLGLCAYYALDVGGTRFAAVLARDATRPEARRQLSLLWIGLFLVESVAFLLYAVLLGHLLADPSQRDRLALISLTLATAIHVFTIDYKLRSNLGTFYDRFLRWGLVLATLASGVASSNLEVPKWFLHVGKSFFVGVLLFSALREKVPAAKDVRYGTFLLGAALFSALILGFEE